ncbi:MAG: 1-deoxyxylulose-5-phosphate synthase [Eubacteriaceae bacterium]|jgi:aryl-alcohol dehydrogenase-like predicted oxidoreductase|nr:1-deoxyxylulose-5-phosphate synthase [Eubacteriaceae bacterium]
MKENQLGKTGIKVSRMCFGSLTIGPLQKNIKLSESRKIIARTLEQGVYFFDTADLYNTYDHLSHAIKIKKDVVIATKSYDYTSEGVDLRLSRALKELGRDYVDIYMLHEQESEKTIEGHWEAIERLLYYKKIGAVRAIGISTHRVEGVLATLNFPEIEVVHPLINLTGIGIEDGGVKEMEAAIALAHQQGKGLYGMKPLGGGNLLAQKKACFDYVLGLKSLDAIAIGVQSVDEVDYNIKKFNGEMIDDELEKRLTQSEKSLMISDWCRGCGQCAAHCSHGAIQIINGQAVVDKERCVLCCYCSAYCHDFCIKVI